MKPHSSVAAFVSACLLGSTSLVIAVPTAVNDTYTGTEDVPLSINSGGTTTLISADFEGAGSVVTGSWRFLDRIQNEYGTNQSYPLDGSGRAWNSLDFDPATSTITPWGTNAMPIQGGGLTGLPGAPDILAGLGGGPNGENIVTTYLFRKVITLNAGTAAVANWSAQVLADDGCIVYVNGQEVGRVNMAPANLTPSGAVTTNTTTTVGDETNYTTLPLNLAGILVAGQNIVAIEVHQINATSSDVGIDFTLAPTGGSLEGGFVYVDDPFGTNRPANASGARDAAAGNPGAALGVDLGRVNSTNFSGGWRQTFNLNSPTTVTVAFDWQVGTRGGLESDEYSGFVMDVDGTRYGTQGTAPALFVGRLYGAGNNQPNLNSNWARASFAIPLSAGLHTLTLGGFANKTTIGSEYAVSYLDNVDITTAGGAPGVLANDTGGAVSAELVSTTTKGVLNLNANGTFTYTPATNSNGVDSFTYRASDGSTLSNVATVTINVTPVNDEPVAAADHYEGFEDVPFMISAALGVLTNDVDPDGPSLTAQLVATTSRGTLTLNGNGSFTYTPELNYVGTDSFTYRVSDGTLTSNTVTVTLNMIAVNDPPVAFPDAYTVKKNAPLVITTPGGEPSTENILLGAVRDGSNNVTTPGSVWKYWDQGVLLQGAADTTWRTLAYNDAAWPQGPSELGYGDAGDNFPEATLIEDNPTPGYSSATDRFWTAYFRKTVNLTDVASITEISLQIMRDDGIVFYINNQRAFRSNINTATPVYTTAATNGSGQETSFIDATNTTLNLEPLPLPSIFVEGDNIFAAEVHQDSQSSSDLSFDARLTITKVANRGLLLNDTDVESDELAAELVTPPSHGSVTVHADGTFTYTPNLGYQGTDSFTYIAKDLVSQSAPATVTLTIVPGGNVAPVPFADAYDATEDITLNVPVGTGVLANDIDPDGDPFTAVLETQANKGVVTLNSNGSFSYVPNPNANGVDVFTYRATDGQSSLPATVTITIAPVNDAPTAIADSYPVDPGQTLLVAAAQGVLANDSDVDGNAITAVLVTSPASGTLTLNPDGSFQFVPAGSGVVTFTYRANDGTLNSATTTVTLIVNGAPVAQADSYAATEDTLLSVTAASGVLSNDSDPEAQPLTALIETQPIKGAVTLNSNGSFVYTPAANAHGVDAFTYRAFDGLRQSTPATVTITIAPVNDPPVAVNDSYTAGVNQMLVVPMTEGVLFNDIDPDSPTLTASLVLGPTNGTVILNADGSFTYTPAAGFVGDDIFSYRASDGFLTSDPGTVTIAVGGGGEDIIVSEIMYHPGTGFPEPLNLEFIEIHNRGTFNVDLSGWGIVTGVDFTFPQGTTLATGGYLVIAANVAAFQAAYPAVTNVVGGWSGTLSNNSNTITLADQRGKKYNTVTYASEGDWAPRVRETTFNGWAWSTAADGGGRSLELRNLALSNDNGQNWAVSVAAGGSPGAQNSVRTTNIAPIIKAVKHSPAVPRSTDTVLVSCELNDESEVANRTATLFWRNATGTSPGAFIQVPMSWDGDKGWFAPVPPQANLAIVEFYISATDGIATRSWPAPTSEGQNANCQYLVSNEVPSPSAETTHLVLTGSENAAFNGVSTSSDRQFNLTLITVRGQETEIRYRCDMRIRGNSSRSYQFKPLRVNIPNDRDLSGWSRFNLNPRSSHLQYTGMRLAQASGLRVPDTIPVELRRNGVESTTSSGSTPDFGLWVRMEDLSGEMVNSHWPLNKDGQIYKTGRPDRFWRSTQAAPNNPDGVLDGWLKQNNSGANDWSDLRNFFAVWQVNAAPHFPGSPAGDAGNSGQGTNTIGNWDGTAFTTGEMTSLDTVADLNQWARWFAFMTILQSLETNISNGQDDDYACYFAPRIVGNTTQLRMELIPHDLDTIFGLGDTSSTPTTRGLFDMTADGDLFRPLLPLFGNNTVAGNAAFRTAYYTALRELLGSVFDTDTSANPNPPFHRFIDYHLTGWAPAATRTTIKDFVNQRRTHLLGLIGSGAITPGTATSNATVTSLHGTLMIHEILADNATAHANGGFFPDTIELRNTGGSPALLAGMSLTDDPAVKDKYIFPAGTTLAAGGFLIVYADSDLVSPGLHLGFGLNAGGDALYLYDTLAAGQTLRDSVVFGLQIPDYSIGRTGGDLNTWRLCTPTIGSPNTEVAALGLPGAVRINEWCGNADYRASDDFIELYNPSLQPVALGGMVLTDDAVNYPARGLMPPLSFMGPTRFVAFETKGSKATPGNARELPYNLGATFGNVTFLGANGVRVDSADTVAQFRDVSVGRLPDGTGTFGRLPLPSPGASNVPVSENSVALLNYLRITEIMYHPVSSGQSEYVEFRNMSDLAGAPITLDLSGVTFSAGITFTFPPGTLLSAGQHLVIAGELAKFQTEFPGVPVVGTFTSKLDNGGERLRFDIPGGVVSILDFTYSDNWYPSTDGDGFALQIVDGTAAPSQWDKKSGWQAALPNPGGSPIFGVSAGADSSGSVASPVYLDGSVFLGSYAASDVTVTWTLDAGPGTATFTTANYQDANARFSQPGTYTLRLTATSPEGSVSDTRQVIVTESYNSWATRTLTGIYASQRGMFDDPDQDGYANVVEFTTGSNPLVPGGGVSVQIEGDRLVMRYTRSKSIDPAIQLIPEISWDLHIWYSGPGFIAEALDSETTTVQNRQAGEIGNIGSTAQHCSLRLKVILP